VSENPPSPESVEAGTAQTEPAPEPVVTPVLPPPPPPYTPASMPPPPQIPPPTPRAQQPPAAPDEPTHDQISHRRRNTVAVVLILIGVVSLMGQFLPSWSWDKWWPLILILIGAFIIFQGMRRKP
jgi:hypothetical protein